MGAGAGRFGGASEGGAARRALLVHELGCLVGIREEAAVGRAFAEPFVTVGGNELVDGVADRAGNDAKPAHDAPPAADFVADAQDGGGV